MTDQTPALQRPATRAARLSAIEQALLTCIVTSQSQLSQILADQGIEVTQATLSRDLDEIHATKTRLADGTVAYALGKQPEEDEMAHPDAKTEQQMNRVLSGLVTSVAAARNLVVVHTPSGAAQYVASVIDKQPIDGDDTVMVICADDDYAKQRAQWLLDVVSKG